MSADCNHFLIVPAEILSSKIIIAKIIIAPARSEVVNINSKAWIIIAAVVLIAGAVLFLRSPPSSITTVVPGAVGVPDSYYFSLKPADIDSPIELVRFASSIRPDTAGLTVAQRVAYFEWYLKNRGFDVSFVSSDNFRVAGQSHVWLLVKNQQGESMYVEPSAGEMKADSICPTIPEYKSYQKKYRDINDLSSGTGGVDKYAWWRSATGQSLFNKSVMLKKKTQL